MIDAIVTLLNDYDHARALDSSVTDKPRDSIL